MRTRSRAARALLGAALVLVAPRAGRAFEALEGRLQLHGFGEHVFRVLNNDFADDYDVAAMQFVLNLELEFDIAPDGWGPFSALSAYSRVEARYDCIWTRGCGLFPSLDAWGNRINKLPHYKTNGQESPWLGTAFSDPTAGPIHDDGRVLKISEAGPFQGLFEEKGPDQLLGTQDDPAPLIFGDLAAYRIAIREVPGPENGAGTQILIPLRPEDEIPTTNGLFRFFTSALSPIERNTVCLATAAKPPGASCRYDGAIRRGDEWAASIKNVPDPWMTDSPFVPGGDVIVNPFRPWPRYTVEQAEAMWLSKTEASGLYLPSPGLRKLLREEKLDLYDQNFSQDELELNRGGSQQDEKELKEFYFDIEFLDGRGFLRLGKQTIVWGKTEIFRSQDQFNPQDLGLATLPSLEESRIALWSARLIYSFYDIGPVQDVRLELGVILDDYEPVDLGRCGEPYVPLPVYGKCLGLLAHGAVGLGLAGEIRPPAWWNDLEGLEAGARLEFRYRRFSFAVTDFYGYDDFPYVDPIFNYERNVDPRTGRPRWGNTREGCDPEGIYGGGNDGCLGNPSRMRWAGVQDPSSVPNISNWRLANVRTENERARFSTHKGQKTILTNSPVNQTLFHFACATTFGFTDLVPGLESECGAVLFNSQVLVHIDDPPLDVPVVEGLSFILGGSTVVYSLALDFLAPGVPPETLPPVIPLNTQDPRTGEGEGPVSLSGASPLYLFGLPTLSSTLTPEQQALLGCGAFFGTSCDRDGMNLMWAEASAILQSFPGFDGTPMFGFNTMFGPQPGTVGFPGGPVCTRFERGRQYMLPGCRGPEDPGYDPAVDGMPFFDTSRNRPGRVLEQIASDVRAFDEKSKCPPIRGGDLSRPNTTFVPEGVRLIHPFTCQPWRSEMAAYSWNLLVLLVIFSSDADGDGFSKPEDFDEFDPARPLDPNRCSVAAPQFCSQVRGLLGATGVRRDDLRAGGNFLFGRRDFLWHGGQELVLRYAKRNVLGLSVDFSEDWSKTNWGVEFTWLESLPQADRNSPTGLKRTDVYNLTVSVDRPTFVNFLNVNRTLFFNTQWFFSYEPQWTNSFSSNGEWNVLGTFTILTGYFQDRLETALTLVYDFQSVSGAGLPSLSYRFSEAFSATFGMAFFFGRDERRIPYLNPQALENRKGAHAYKDYVENGLAVVRDRDEVFFSVRMTF